jgi:secreted trypsin-like serine protease
MWSSFGALMVSTMLQVGHGETMQHSSGGHADKRIVGGKDAVKGRYPAYGIPTGSVLCGATLIAPDLMLSAAHCKGAFTEGSSTVAIGGIHLDFSDAVEVIGVMFEVAHPEYDAETAANDVMLIKLDQAASATPVVMNDQTNLPADGDKVRPLLFVLPNE